MPSERVAPAVSAQTFAEAMKALSDQEANVISFKARYYAEVDAEGVAFTQSFQGSIFYQRPNQYRIKGFTRFGGLVFDFVLSGDIYALRVEEHPRPIIGGIDNFQKLGDFRLPVLLSLQAVEVVLGKLSFDSERIVAVQDDGKSYQFDVFSNSKQIGGAFSQRIVVDKISLQVRQLEYMDPEGKAVVSIQTSDFRQVHDSLSSKLRAFSFPFDVRVENHIDVGNIALEFEEIKANEPLEGKMFTLTDF